MNRGMSRGGPRRRTSAFAAVVALALLTGCDLTDERAESPRGPVPETSSAAGTASASPDVTPSSRGCTIAAAGDIAGEDFETGAARTADLIKKADPRAVIAVGDTAYDAGTPEEFAEYYDPTWGVFKAKTLPVPGNHEYDEDDGAGYRGYFGQPAGKSRGVDVCGWRVVLVNQYAGVDAGASFITSDAARHRGVPLMVVWHQPRYSSGSEHGSDDDVQPLWAAAVRAGASVVLNGHDHDYERFDELDASGRPTAGGTRQFVTGLGGHHIRTFDDILSTSQSHFTGTPAVLFLTLRAQAYSWSEQTADRAVVDQGTAKAGPR